MSDKNKTNDSKANKSAPCRRDFIKSATTAVAVGSALAAPAILPKTASGAPSPVPGGNQRAADAAAIRIEAAQAQLDFTKGLDPQENNGDDDRYANQNYYASFTKTLPHDSIGEVDPAAYQALLSAIASEDPGEFNDVPLDFFAARTLANPQGGFRYIFAGLDGHATRINPAPEFRTAAAAVEMAEVYWLALTRDIPFSQYRSNRFIEAAINDMTRIDQDVFPFFQKGNLTTDTIFRGETPGDLVGPYISQFLWKDVPYGPTTIEQRYYAPLPGMDFMVEEQEWLAIQRGGRPLKEPEFDKTARYITNNRGLGEYVHDDILFQAYFNALLIALDYGRAAIAVENPYGISIFNQGGFTSLGGPWFIDLLTQAGNLALNGAWYQKWSVHRRLRPEVYAGRIHHHLEGNATYELPSEILDSFSLDLINKRNGGTYFLPMQYEEGSPTHPSYVAGHAAVAGACCTVLKAICNEDFIILDPEVPTPDGLKLVQYRGGETIRLGNEINKLAANISLGRDAAGVHYRTDGIEGLLLGEQQAIGLLRDYSTAINENFGGFNFTGFLGNPVSIIDGVIS